MNIYLDRNKSATQIQIKIGKGTKQYNMILPKLFTANLESVSSGEKKTKKKLEVNKQRILI